MIRRTSIATYKKIKANGLLSNLRFQVYDLLYQHGPLTAGELWNIFFKDTRQRSSISARMSELEERGVVYQAYERPCAYTKNLSIAWDVTDNIPTEPPPKTRETKTQKIIRLEKQIAQLENELSTLDGMRKCN